MSAIRDGGPAFPIQNKDFTEAYGGAPGMALRDWFAGQCMRDTFAALAAAGWSNLNAYQMQRCAEASYAAADAMLAARMSDADLAREVAP